MLFRAESLGPLRESRRELQCRGEEGVQVSDANTQEWTMKRALGWLIMSYSLLILWSNFTQPRVNLFENMSLNSAISDCEAPSSIGL